MRAFFASMNKFPDSSLSHSELLYIAHKLSSNNKIIDHSQDDSINQSIFLPEPESLNQISSLSLIKKMGTQILGEITRLFDKSTFDFDERILSADEIISS